MIKKGKGEYKKIIGCSHSNAYERAQRERERACVRAREKMGEASKSWAILKKGILCLDLSIKHCQQATQGS